MNNHQISDSWNRGDSYERYIGQWSRKIAPLFLEWINCASDLRWLDVGCGTGALSAAILDHCAPGQVLGVEPSEGFRKTAEENLAGQVTLYPGSATEIPLAPASVDRVVSGLVLNFVDDPDTALHEAVRVTQNGGTIGAYVWDYAGKMELIRIFWDAATELDPDAKKLDEGIRFPICNPQALEALFTRAGLHDTAVTALDTQTTFKHFDDYWQPFLGGQGPAPSYVTALDEDARTRLRNRLRDMLPTQADGSITLLARAWAVRGTVNSE